MELYGEILRDLLLDERVEVTFPGLTITPQDILTSTCYRALVQIRDIIRDDSCTDEECCFKIEKIIRVLEEIGSDGGLRHSFE